MLGAELPSEECRVSLSELSAKKRLVLLHRCDHRVWRLSLDVALSVRHVLATVGAEPCVVMLSCHYPCDAQCCGQSAVAHAIQRL